MKIRHATADDIPRLLQLATESQSAAQWSVQQYNDLFPSHPQAERLAIIAVETGEESAGPLDQPNALGFLIARHLAPEWELENIVVARASRQKGIGKQLLETLLTAARETNSESVFLEVRGTNSPARALYERLGFHATGRRKSYYSNPLEDAIVYRLALL